MNDQKRYGLLMMCCLAMGAIYFLAETADAARFGRGRSFGSKPNYQRSAPAPSQNNASPQAKPGQTTQQQPTAATPSPMGRWGGMLGGFLMGGLIGSLLFGGHGFGGPGLMDLLVIGGGLFLLFRFLRSRRMAAESASPGGAMMFDGGPGMAWGGSSAPPAAQPSGDQPPSLPPGFDPDEFLKGANAIYSRLQASWDKRDLADIRQFTSPEVFAEIQEQAQEDPVPGKTDILMITPRIIEARDAGHQTIVSVLYDVMLRENEDKLSKQVRELWHFSRERDHANAFWMLEGIQQVA